VRIHKNILAGGSCGAVLLALGTWHGVASSQSPATQSPAVQPPSVQSQAEPAYDTVGPIEGDAISVQGPLNIEVVRGQTKTILRSGSDVRVNSGQAHVSLVEGGEIAVCGPAHFSVLKSVNLLTIALDGGVLHAHIERTPLLTVYTAQLQLKPIAIGDGVQDLLIGFDATGAMCVHPSSGALRVEQQLTAQNIVIPQGADIVVANAQLDSLSAGNGRCACDLQLAKAVPPAPELEISRPSTTEEIKKDAEAKAKSPKPPKTAAPASDEPVYQVFMPPLSYDATAKVQRDDFDPNLIVLVRRVRVRSSLIFQGRVASNSSGGGSSAPKPTPSTSVPSTQPRAPSTNSTPPPATQQAQPPKKPQSPDTFMNRARSLWHKVFP
jgi:hypothetical protein